MATHSSVLAWRIPGTVEPGGLLSMGSHRVGHDWRDLAAAAWGAAGNRMISLKSARLTPGGFNALMQKRKKSSLKKRNPIEFPLGVDSFLITHKAEPPTKLPSTQAFSCFLVTRQKRRNDSGQKRQHQTRLKCCLASWVILATGTSIPSSLTVKNTVTSHDGKEY